MIKSVGAATPPTRSIKGNQPHQREEGQNFQRRIHSGRQEVATLLNDKSETVYPAVSTDALILSFMIGAHERRDDTTATIASEFLKASIDDSVHTKCTSASVNTLCALNP